MQSVWAADWGDGTSFEIGVEGGAVDPVPGFLRQPAAFFRARFGGAQMSRRQLLLLLASLLWPKVGGAAGEWIDMYPADRLVGEK